MKLETRTGRKRALAAVAAGVAIGALGIGGWRSAAGANSAAPPSLLRPQVTTPADGTPSGQTGGLMFMREGGLEMLMTPLSGKAPTWAEIQQVYKTVSIAAAATAKYKDLAAAERDGYRTAPDLFVESQGAHYYNPLYLREAEHGTTRARPSPTGSVVSTAASNFDPAHPPFLVYNTINGRPTLSGLMFYLPASMTPGQLARIFPASMASWHQHINVCVGGGTSLLNGKAILHYYDAASCAAHGGRFVGNTGWMVHTWIGQANGSGLFDMDMARGTAGGMSMTSPPQAVTGATVPPLDGDAAKGGNR